ncbi:hypothetical protein [Undibacterium sp. TC9W]|uniref:hypothetical protein n=1 Tax=Undibacterium sp. TC9W TaxID=3413053 RepID=UPI003BF3BE9C
MRPEEFDLLDMIWPRYCKAAGLFVFCVLFMNFCSQILLMNLVDECRKLTESRHAICLCWRSGFYLFVIASVSPFHIVLTILNAKQQTGKSFWALTGIMGMCACNCSLCSRADALPMVPGQANADNPGAGQAARHPENR